MCKNTETQKREKKRRRRRPVWLEKLAVLAIRILAATVRLMPLALSRFLARGAGRLIFFICGPNFANVGRNLDIAFGPDLDPKQRRALARGFWLHVCQGAMEALHLATWTAENCRQYVDLSGVAMLDELKASGRGAILVSGHLGSWEVGPYTLALLGYPIHLLHNPGTIAPIFEYLRSQRERSGMRLLSRKEHPWILKKAIDRGAWLSIAADVNAGRRGAFIPFFDVPASTHLSPAALQQAARCPIVVGSTARQPDGKHRFHVWLTIPYEKPEDPERGRIETMTAINKALEKAIRTYPEQWLWNYRRWRRRPEGEAPTANGLPPKNVAKS
jgi:KDO2-lipid IV(A) lauroyltransferase